MDVPPLVSDQMDIDIDEKTYVWCLVVIIGVCCVGAVWFAIHMLAKYFRKENGDDEQASLVSERHEMKVKAEWIGWPTHPYTSWNIISSVSLKFYSCILIGMNKHLSQSNHSRAVLFSNLTIAPQEREEIPSGISWTRWPGCTCMNRVESSFIAAW